MSLLIAGVLFFALIHFIPSLARPARESALRRLGDAGYKGLFSLLLLGSLALIILGWRSTVPNPVYPPPLALHGFALGLLAVAFLLLVVSNRPSRLRGVIRHPQLTGVALWGISHLLLNGDDRAIVLFGGLTAWAALEIVLINKREGVWIKTPAPGWGAELINIAIAAVIIAVVVFIHPWLSGMPVW
jgi:uncharacterized membrane protein